MIVDAIRAALETRLDTITPKIATARENQSFDATAVPASQPYQQVYLLLADPDNPEQGSSYREQGVFQVNLQYPQNLGPGAAHARAELIRAAFPRSLSLVNGAVTVTISRTVAIGSGRVDGSRWMVPVKISWHSNVAFP